ncbi:MAG TPA: carboxypeptidase regulatory-like domain-containing protein, partial [Planctomycetota bacterium]|nr:carboxypeptidase regulatory-like domain-containing protein [Planctomycetota bacterium]
LVAGATSCGGGSPPAPETDHPRSPEPSATPPPSPGVIAGRAGLQLREPPLPSEPLPHVFVYVKEGLEGRTFPLPKEPVLLDQVNFQFVPHVFGLRAGQTLRITSQDTSQHNVFCQPFNNPGFNLSMFGGESLEKSFLKPEVMILFQCNIHHIMKAYAGVLDHPFFAVSGPDGRFEIQGLPPGRYKVAAWHELMGIREWDLELARDHGVTVDVSYR